VARCSGLGGCHAANAATVTTGELPAGIRISDEDDSLIIREARSNVITNDVQFIHRELRPAELGHGHVSLRHLACQFRSHDYSLNGLMTYQTISECRRDFRRLGSTSGSETSGHCVS
jgi:hypothetical protein